MSQGTNRREFLVQTGAVRRRGSLARRLGGEGPRLRGEREAQRRLHRGRRPGQQRHDGRRRREEGQGPAHDLRRREHRRALRRRRRTASTTAGEDFTQGDASTATSARCSTRRTRRSTRSSSPRPTTPTPSAAVARDAAGQARLLREAADALDPRGPHPDRDWPPGRRSPPRWATRATRATTPGGSSRSSARARSARSSEVHAWTNRPIWPQGIDRPDGHRPRPAHLHWDLWLGPAPERPYVANKVTRARRGADLSPVRLARLVGLRHRRPRRHGLPHPRRLLLGPRPEVPDSVEARRRAPQARNGPEVGDRPLRVPRPGRHAPAQAHLVRRRQEAPGRACSKARRSKSGGSLLIGEKGKIYVPDDYGGTARPPAQGEVRRLQEPARDDPRVARPPQGLGRGLQGPGPPGLLELQLFGAADRDGPARRRRLPDRPEDRVGRPEHEGHELLGGRGVHPPGVSQGLGALTSPSEASGGA